MADEPQTIEAVRQILIQLATLVEAGLPPQRIDRIRREVIFFLYEGGEAAKWDFARPHSSAARRLREEANATGRYPLRARRAITYDHAIPLKTLRQGLREVSLKPLEFRTFLARFVRGVVITREEDEKLTSAGLRSRLPEGASADDVMARYRAAKIAFDPDDERRLVSPNSN